MKFSYCIEMLFTEVPFLERFEKAKKAGAEYVEFWNWDNKDIDAIERKLQETGLKIAAFQGSSKGVMVDDNEHGLFLDGVKKGLDVANRLGCKCVFLMGETLGEDRAVLPTKRPLSSEQKRENTIKAMRAVAPLAEKAGVVGVIEPLNTLVDHAGYSLSHTADGAEMVREVNSPYVRLLYDAYHMQIMEGNIINNIKAYADTFGHFHIADVPGRNQPGVGEMNYKNILCALQSTGYDKLVGWEFEPTGGSSDQVVKETLELLGV